MQLADGAGDFFGKLLPVLSPWQPAQRLIWSQVVSVVD
jgi:hypothetical protein